MLDKNSPYVLVVGLGKTGYSCVHYFLKENKRVKVTDSRSNPPYHDQVRDLIGAENVYHVKIPDQAGHGVEQLALFKPLR